MARAFWAELKKARRRHDGLLLVLLALTELIWCAGGTPDESFRYSALLYDLPVVHLLVMPVGMAVLASHLWDAETKANTPKLLYTLQSRGSLYAAKTALAALYLGLLAGLEAAGILALGRLSPLNEPLDPRALLWTLAAGGAVEFVIYLAFTFLQLRSGSPVLILGMGLGCSMLGFFLAMVDAIEKLPEGLLLLLPFCWFAPLSGMGMQWDAAARAIAYVPLPHRHGLLAVVLAVGAVLAAADWRAVKNREV